LAAQNLPMSLYQMVISMAMMMATRFETLSTMWTQRHFLTLMD
jgi:hypothetical protein